MNADFLNRAAERAAPRRFTGAPLTGFGELLPTDSLVARIERIWNMKPSVVEVTVAYTHPDDDNELDIFKTAMTRAQAAQTLRRARRSRLLIEASVTGYCISGAARGDL